MFGVLSICATKNSFVFKLFPVRIHVGRLNRPPYHARWNRKKTDKNISHVEMSRPSPPEILSLQSIRTILHGPRLGQVMDTFARGGTSHTRRQEMSEQCVGKMGSRRA